MSAHGIDNIQPSAEAQFDAEKTQSVLNQITAVPTPNNTGEGAALSYPTMQNDNAAEGLRMIIEENQEPVEQLSNEQPQVIPQGISIDGKNAATEEELKKLMDYFKSVRINPNDPIVPDEFLFQWGGIDFAPRKNLISVKAESKAGKTFALTAICSAFLTGNNGGLGCYAATNERILYVDTEQADSDTQKILKRLINESPEAAERAIILNLRTVEPRYRIVLVEAYARQYDPKLIVVDGIVDLIPGMDYNEMESADNVITRLCRIAEERNAVVLTAIHVNKNDDKATGWLGRLLLQKCAVEMMVEKDKTTGQRLLKPTAVRHKEFPSISFEIINTEDGFGKARIIPLDEAQDVADTMKQLKKKREALEMLIGWGITDKAYTKQAFQERVKSAWAKEKGKDCSRQNYYAILQNGLKCGALRSELRKSGEETIEWIIIEN